MRSIINITGTRAVLLSLLWIGSSALCVSFCNRAAANPSHAAPRTLLPIHMTKLNKEVFELATKNYQEAYALIEKLTALRERNRLDSASPKDFEKLFGHFGHLQDRAKRLRLSGETTGYDLKLRGDQLRAIYTTLLSEFKGTRSYQSALQRAQRNAKRFEKDFERETKLIAKLVSQGKTQEAWDQLMEAQYETLAEAHTMLIDAPPKYDLDVTNRDLKGQIELLWQKQGHEAIIAKRDATMPDLKKILDELSAAAKKVQVTGAARIGDANLAGPAIAAHFLGQWRKAHVAVIRAAALEYGRQSIPGKTTPVTYNEILQKYQQFCGQMGLALGQLVSAHARQASVAEAAKVHQQYLAVLGPLAAELGPGSSLDPLRKALGDFALKSSELNGRITAYRDATSELLRWRERVAAAELKKAAQEDHLLKHLRTATVVANTPTLYAPRYEKTAELYVPTPDCTAAMSKLLLTKPCRIESGAKASATAATMIGRYFDRTYCILSDATAFSAPHRNQLMNDLLVSEQHPPLTLDAAAAVASANLGMFEQAGGEITGFYLESAVTRMATLPDAAQPFIRLGPINQEPPPRHETLRQLVVRCDLKTKWVANRYFFAQAQ